MRPEVLYATQPLVANYSEVDLSLSMTDVKRCTRNLDFSSLHWRKTTSDLNKNSATVLDFSADGIEPKSTS